MKPASSRAARDSRRLKRPRNQKQQRTPKEIPLAFKKLNVPNALSSKQEKKLDQKARHIRRLAAHPPERAPSLMNILFKHHKPTSREAQMNSKSLRMGERKMNSEIAAEKRHKDMIQSKWRALEKDRRKLIQRKNRAIEARHKKLLAQRRHIAEIELKEARRQKYLRDSTFLAKAAQDAQTVATQQELTRRQAQRKHDSRAKITQMKQQASQFAQTARREKKEKARLDAIRSRRARNDAWKAEYQRPNNPKRQQPAPDRVQPRYSSLAPTSTVPAIRSTQQMSFGSRNAGTRTRPLPVTASTASASLPTNSLFSSSFRPQYPVTGRSRSPLPAPTPKVTQPQPFFTRLQSLKQSIGNVSRQYHGTQTQTKLNTIQRKHWDNGSSLFTRSLFDDGQGHQPVEDGALKLINQRKGELSELKQRQRDLKTRKDMMDRQLGEQQKGQNPVPKIKNSKLRRAARTSRLHSYLFDPHTEQKKLLVKNFNTANRANKADIRELEREIVRLERIRHQKKFSFIPMVTRPLPSLLHSALAHASTNTFLSYAERFPQLLQNTRHPLYLLINDKLQRASLPAQMKIKNRLQSHVEGVQQKLHQINKMKIFEQQPPKLLSPFQRNNINSELSELRRLARFTPLFVLEQVEPIETVPVYFQHDEFIHARHQMKLAAQKENRNNNWVSRWAKKPVPQQVNFYQHQLLKNQLERLTYFKNRHQAAEQQWMTSILLDGKDANWGKDEETWWKRVFSWSDVNTKSKKIAAYEENRLLKASQTAPQINNVVVLPQSNDDELFISRVDGANDAISDPNLIIYQEDDSTSVPHTPLQTHSNHSVPDTTVHGDNTVTQSSTPINHIRKKVSQTLHIGRKTIKMVKKISLFERTLKYVRKNCQIQPLPGEVRSKHLKYDFAPFLLIPDLIELPINPSENHANKSRTVSKQKSGGLGLTRVGGITPSPANNNSNTNTTSQTLNLIKKSNTNNNFTPSHTRFGNVGIGLIDGFNAAPVAGRF